MTRPRRVLVDSPQSSKNWPIGPDGISTMQNIVMNDRNNASSKSSFLSSSPSSQDTIHLTERGKQLFERNLLGTSRSVIQPSPLRPVFKSSPLRQISSYTSNNINDNNNNHIITTDYHGKKRNAIINSKTTMSHQSPSLDNVVDCSKYHTIMTSKSNDSSQISNKTTPQRFKDREQDVKVINRREKQIMMGKMTAEYEQYSNEIPKRCRSPLHPSTPKKYQMCSRRSFDAQIKIWRKKLHHWHDLSIDLDQIMISNNSARKHLSRSSNNDNSLIDSQNDLMDENLLNENLHKKEKLSHNSRFNKGQEAKKILFEANR